ncbi:hypothetical protein FRB93_013097 [Tulasnella sp. JGI-2019a]|nr:hypothetical protein FRB93_013097 [Tulasnella sp. JGI-2019a]
MPYVRLGKSGLKVSKIILGCMSYGSTTWQEWALGEEEGIKHIKLAYDLGINAFDTADFYSNGLPEIVLGKAIKQHNLPRDEIVVMTKTYFPFNRDPNCPAVVGQSPEKLDSMRYTNQYGLSRKHIFEAIKHSLERLQLDYVDIYQCHRFDANTPVEETMQALHDVVKAGYARYIGMSSCYAWQFHKMQNYARARGLTEFVSMQDYHCATYREEEREMIPLCEDLGVGVIPWSPLARGFLTRPVTEQTTRGGTDFGKYAVGDHEKWPFMKTINERVVAIAKERNVSMAQVALAWSCSKPFVSAPIVGTTSVEKLHDLVAGVHLKLTTEEIKSIDDPYEPRPIVGHM